MRSLFFALFFHTVVVGIGLGCAASDHETNPDNGATDVFGVPEDALRAQIAAEVADENYLPPDARLECALGPLCQPAFWDSPPAIQANGQTVAVPIRFAVFGTASFRATFPMQRLNTVIGLLNYAFNPENNSISRGHNSSRFVFDNVAAENLFDEGPQGTLSAQETQTWTREYHMRTNTLRRDRLTLYFFADIYDAPAFSVVPANNQRVPTPAIFVPVASILSDNHARMVIGHEVGHWLGLLHTFRGGCTAEDGGDLVTDTPRHTNGFLGIWTRLSPCNGILDSCSSDPGPDPVRNYMSYSSCDQNEFTPGQFARMHAAWSHWYQNTVHR